MSPLLRTATALGALVVLLLGWTAVAALQARDHLLDARAGLQALQQDDATGLTDALLPVQRAERELHGAHRLLHGWTGAGPAAVARVPLLGRSVEALRRVTDASWSVVSAGVPVLATLQEQPLLREGAVDVEALERTGVLLQRAEARARPAVTRLLEAETGLLPGAVARGLSEAQEGLAPVPDLLQRAVAGAQVLPRVLGQQRDQRVLLVLENNAELRGTGGVITVFAEGRARRGRVDVGGFRDVEEVSDPAAEAVRVPAPPDYRRLWGPYKADTTLWKNVGMSPLAPQSSAVLAAVARRSLGRAPDVVVWLDVRTIAAVLGATGPDRLPDGRALTADDAVRLLLSEAYLRAPDTIAGQRQRRATLRGAADAVLSRLLDPSGSEAATGALVSALAESAAGRHVHVWSADPEDQRLLEAAGLAGDVRAGDGDLASFTVQNLGGGQDEGNKLDYYARRQTTVRATVGRDAAQVEQVVQLRNTAPARGLPAYVAGLDAPGTSNNLVTLALPPTAVLQEFRRDDVPVPTQLLPEGDHRVLTDVAVLRPGATATWRLRYRLPVRDGRYGLTVVPQPLAVDSGLLVELEAGQGLQAAAVPGAPARWSGPLVTERRFALRAAPRPLLERVRSRVGRFWREPVRLPALLPGGLAG